MTEYNKDRTQNPNLVSGKGNIQGNTALTVVPTTQTQTGPKEFPFYPPNPKFPTWNKDMACTESLYFLLQKASGCADPFSDNKVPTLFFTPNVYQEVLYIVKRMTKKTGECGAFLTIKQLQDAKPHFLAYDYFLTGQVASGGEVEMDGPDTVRYWNYLREKFPAEFGTNLHSKIAHVHSHGGMNSFWSGTDQTQQNSAGQLGFMSDYRIYLVFGKDGNEIKAGFVQYYPFFHRIEDINLGLYFGDQQYNTKMTRERKKELDEHMDALITKRATFVGAGIYGHGTAHPPAHLGYPRTFTDDDPYGYYGQGSHAAHAAWQERFNHEAKSDSRLEVKKEPGLFDDLTKEETKTLTFLVKTFCEFFASEFSSFCAVDPMSQEIYDLVPGTLDYKFARAFRCYVNQLVKAYNTVPEPENYQTFMHNLRWLVDNLTTYFEDPAIWQALVYSEEEYELADVAATIVAYNEDENPTAALADYCKSDVFCEIMLTDYNEDMDLEDLELDFANQERMEALADKLFEKDEPTGFVAGEVNQDPTKQ